MRAKALKAVRLTELILESSYEMGTGDSESSGSASTEEPDCSELEDLVAALELLKIDVINALEEAKADLEDCLAGG